MIKVSSLDFSYGKNEIFKDVNFEFENTGLYILKAPSGEGKSTFLKLLCGKEKPTRGSINVGNVELSSLNSRDVAELKLNYLQYLNQSSEGLKFLKVKDYILLPSYFSSSKIKGDIKSICHDFDIKNIKQKVSKLSGGEFKRVNIIKTILNGPRIILLDEPTAGLDYNHKKSIYDVLKTLSKTHLIIVATHDDFDEFLSSYFLMKIVNKNIEISKINIEEKQSKKEENFNITFRKHSCIKGIVKYNFLKIFSKPFRSYFSIIIITISLLVFSLTLGIISSVNESLFSEANSLINNSTFVIKSDNKNAINFRSLDYNNVTKSLDDEKINYEHVQYLYDANFENLFKDENSAFIKSNADLLKLNNFNVRQLNEFEFVDYPLDKEEVILKLKRDNIYLLSEFLNLKNDLEIINDYLTTNQTIISFELKNEEFGYSQNIEFYIKQIWNSPTNIVLSNNKFFNKIIFQDILGFPIIEDTHINIDSPNTLRRYTAICFSSLKNMYEYEDKLSEDIIVDNGCTSILKIKHDNIYGIPYYTNNKLIKMNNDNLFIEGSPLGYYIDFNSGLSGFYGKLFLTANDNKIDDIKKFYDNKDNLNYSIKDDAILESNILNLSNDSFKLKPIQEDLLLNEIIISSSLASKLQLKIGELIHMLYFMDGTYYQMELVINDIKESKQLCIYQKNKWFNHLLRDRFFISSLVNTSSMVECYINNLNEKIKKDLIDSYNKYELSFASYDNYISISSYLKSLVNIVIFLFLIATLINFIIIHYINLSIEADSEKEKDELMLIGLTSQDLFMSSSIREYIILGISFIYTMIFLTIFKIIFSKFISSKLPVVLIINFKIYLFAFIYLMLNLIPLIIINICKIKRIKR